LEKAVRRDPEIEEKRPVINIVKIVFHATLHLLQRIGISAVSIDLSPASKPVMPGLTLWRRGNDEISLANVSFCAVACGRGPTIDDRHVTGQDIEQLGKLVRRRKRPSRVTRGSCLEELQKVNDLFGKGYLVILYAPYTRLFFGELCPERCILASQVC